MSFLDNEFGKVTGTEKDAFTSFTLIPDNYETVAVISEIKLAFHNGEKFYEVAWQIWEGEFKERKVFQKIRCFSADAQKKYRALNQLVLLFKICGIEHSFEYAPNDTELMQFIGKKAQVKIRQWQQDGKSGNVVVEFHKYNEELEDVPF